MSGNTEVVALLMRYAPFDAMAPEDLEFLAENVDVRTHAKDDVIVDPSAGVPRHLYIVASGSVLSQKGLADEGAASGADLRIGAGECFPLGSLMSGSPISSVYRALEETVCYLLPESAFRAVKERSAPFRDFCTRRLASLLERSKRILKEASADGGDRTPMDRLLSSVVRRKPVTCRPEDSIESVLAIMRDQAVGSVVAVDDDQRPVGIFTLHDVLNRVALPRQDLAAPIASVFSTDLAKLPSHATSYEAALEMVRRGIRHVIVVDDGRIAGVVSERDLFNIQRVSLRQLSRDIKQAPDLNALIPLAGDIRSLAQTMLVDGVASEQLTQFIASLNDLLTVRLLELEFRAADLRGVEFCWIALGSEGRLEQTLATDQDNGIIFETPPGLAPDEARRLLLPIAQRVNQSLDACGYPLCKGEIMAGNPRWCLSGAEWRAEFARWIDSGDPEALLHGSIFFDFRPLYGAARLAEDLRTWLAKHAKSHPKFLHQMAENALRNRPPLGLFRDFTVESSGENKGTIDLKLNGATLFVDAARIYSLATGVSATNTAQRLRAVAPVLHIPADELDAWVEAFFYIQNLRLRNQHAQSAQGRAMGNRVRPEELHQLDRTILKESLRQAKNLQTRLALDYQA
ncbi:MAG: putative nucleotidyltransferase substrate binding domain-containing protein [Pseudomonadota bacterium]